MNDHRVVFDHREEVRQNLAAQVGLCREIATITSDSGLAVEWNDFAAEMDALIQTIGETNRQDAVQQAA